MDAARRYVRSQNNPALSNQLTGFLALVGSYILGGAKAKGVLTYAKNVMPFMSRSKLDKVFSTLSPAEQAWFRKELKDPDERLSTEMGWPPMSDNLLKHGSREGQNEKREPEKYNASTRATTFSIGDWLDDLSRSESADDRLAGKVAGHGRLATAANGVVTELRRLKGDVEHTEWKSFALAAFDLVVLLKTGVNPRDPQIPGDDNAARIVDDR